MASPTLHRDDWTHERVLADIGRLALRAHDRVTFFDEAAARLRDVVPFDGACWHTLDPGSGLITQHHLQDLPDRFPVLAHNEYVTPDVNKFTDLATRARPAATLAQVTGGHLDSSARYRELLVHVGVVDELRSVFVADGAAWGALIAVRMRGRPAFTDRDVTLLADASAVLARAVRRGLVSEASASVGDAPDAPGVVEFDAAGDVVRVSSSAQPLLEEISGSTVEAGLGSPALRAVASAAHAALEAHPSGAVPALPSSTIRCPSGKWLVLHGGILDPSGSRGVGVFMQRAHPMTVAPLLLKAYGLTPREQQVAQLVLRGATTAQISSRLSISAHTVSDHMKVIFDKTGSRTRGELSASLFFGEHLPRIEHAVTVGDDASFVDAPRPRGMTDDGGASV